MRACPQCHTELREAARFCDACGLRLTPAESAPQPPPRAYTPAHLAERILAEHGQASVGGSIEGERKTITALFADIKGSMDLLEDLDPDDARRIVDPALQRMMDAVHRYEGFVAQSTGDGIFAMFGAPLAHEDHAQRALYAALHMQAEIERYAGELRLEKGLNLQIRIGINTGEVVLRSVRRDDLHADYTPIGHSTGLAARMESLASPGSIVVSAHTYQLTEGYFDFKALGPARVKGASAPIDIYELIGIGPLRTRLEHSARRGLTPFVGRARELEHVRNALDRAAAGQAQIVALMGDAGVGKSRLTLEIKRLAAGRFRVLETAARSTARDELLHPVIDLLKDYFGFAPSDDVRRRREKVTGRLLTLDPRLDHALPPILALLGLGTAAEPHGQSDPETKRQQVFHALRDLLWRESAEQPVVLIVEDLHWLDADTQAFLNFLAGSLEGARLVLLVNYRREYAQPWTRSTDCTEVPLDPLGEADAHALLSALVGDRADLATLKQLIIAKTGGNPFFIEEIVLSLREQGVLTEAAAHVTPTDLQIPATVQGVLAARIDRLGAEEKSTLQALAVIGSEFTADVVEHVTGLAHEAVHTHLSRLRAAEFIYDRPALPAPTYTFRHALTQDVAYASLLSERRQVLHLRTAHALEQLLAGRLDDQYSVLAHHYRHGGDIAMAVDCYQQAGNFALQRSAHAEAAHFLQMALTLQEQLPPTAERLEQALLLQVSLARALMLMHTWADPEVERAYARARELADQVGESPHYFFAMGGIIGFHMSRGDLRSARELGTRFIAMTAGFSMPLTARAGHYIMGQVSYHLGEFTAAREHLEHCLVTPTPEDHLLYAIMGVENLDVGSRAYMAMTLWHLGYPDQAMRHSAEAVTYAHRLAHPFTLAYALLTAAQLHQCRREPDPTLAQAEALLELSERHKLLFRVPAATLRGWALIEQGQVNEGLQLMRAGLETFRGKAAALRAPNLACLVEAYGKSGGVEEALGIIAEALAAIERTDERQCESALHRLKGELLLRQSEPSSDASATAEHCFRHALTIARRQQSPSLELQAALSLARLCHTQGRLAEVMPLIAGIYARFTEGFDTADLREAKAWIGRARGIEGSRDQGKSG